MSEDGEYIDIELYMMAHYLQHGQTLEYLCNLSEFEKSFMIAGMLVMKKQDTENDIALAKFTGQMANPFIKKK
jgi:hypothetical protein